jgi:hypothetical protein
MEPPKDCPDPYGYFHKPDPNSSSNYPETVQSNLGPPYSYQSVPNKPIVSEDDSGFTSHNINNSEFTLYLAIKRRAF